MASDKIAKKTKGKFNEVKKINGKIFFSIKNLK